MPQDKFGSFIRSGEESRAHRVERAPRPRSSQWSWDEINPLTRVLIVSSAFRVPGHAGEKGRMSFEDFAQNLREALPVDVTTEAESRLTWGRGPGLQRFVLESVGQQFRHRHAMVLDTVQAIADISRLPSSPDHPSTTDRKMEAFNTSYIEADYAAACVPLRGLSLLAIYGLTSE